MKSEVVLQCSFFYKRYLLKGLLFQTFHMADGTCPRSVQSGFTELLKLFEMGKEGTDKIEKIFSLCPGQMSKQFLEKNVIAWARNAFAQIAMMDYPYATSFTVVLPGNPVNLACSYMRKEDKLVGLAKITGEHGLVWFSNSFCGVTLFMGVL